MGSAFYVQAAVTEKLPPDVGVPYRSNTLVWLVSVTVPIVLMMTIYWLWWKSKVRDLKAAKIPTAATNRHVAIATVMVYTFYRNKMIDANVLFFQMLRGLAKIHVSMGYGIFWMWTGMRPVVVVFQADLFEAILKSPTNLKKSFDYGFLSLWLKEGLVTSHGNKWKQRRRTITATFHYKILEDFVTVFDDQSRILIKRLKAVASQDFVNIVPYVTMCTLDVICETAMGIRINAQVDEDIDYLKSMHKVCESFVSRVMKPWIWPNWIYFATAEGRNFKKNAADMDVFTLQVIRNKKKELLDLREKGQDVTSKEKRKALLDMLLELHLDDPKNFTESDIQEEVDSFMFAGHDTTAVSTGWALYLLGLYPEIQVKVQEEIEAVMGQDPERKITEADIREMKYLDCVIKEVQRLYAPAPYIGRELSEDVTVNGITIPAGSTCMLLIYMLHRDERFFPNPEVFDPDRFQNSSVERHPYAFCPFSAGPRSCIGQKFALLEEKVIVSNILRNFSVRSLDERDQMHMTAEMVLRSRKGIRLKLTPRK